ncbi:MAG: arsenosugar biosynthesis radical SAM protein ArsS [Candidatus Omnitrophica bacterium]|nr:arsenosugar biosynthesis radical SAM protein ArsS [Candidatus Omnitrophota bacterium]
MNTFLNVLEKHEIKSTALCRTELTTLQVNMGDLCNQACAHCHIEASPKGKKIMSRKTVDDILFFLKSNKIKTLDITGGAPELNPNFGYFVESARPLVNELIVRSNLTVLLQKNKKHLPEFFRLNKVHLICSLPCYTKENVDRQRGAGVFEKSIRALKLLNEKGFTLRGNLQMDLVYNALGAYLPGSQVSLEKDYKKVLKENFGIEFNRLLTITNVPIKKFKNYLDSAKENEKYSDVLTRNFNPATIENLMCRSFLSVGHDGRLYDCDFNLALGYYLKDKSGHELNIKKLRLEHLKGREIITGEHCLACTAGNGSSCQGALTSENKCALNVQKDAQASVKEYYGKILKTKNDLKTSSCCSIEAFAEPMKSIIKNIEPEILDKFYGCGSPLPPLLEGCRVLDLGSGTGRDVYIASSLVGQEGFVTGIDMTDEQLNIARKHKDAQMKRFGFKRCNVDFKKGYIEDLKEAGIKDNSQDVVISNCVINLSPDKKKVFSEIFRVLKPGGELYFSDVFADRRVPDDVKNDPVLYGECLGGAMYIEDFRRMLRDLGCMDVRYMSKRAITINDPKILKKTGNITFCSVTVRAFKLDDLEDICEDFGQVAYYQGTIPGLPHQFVLDDHHVFFTGIPMLVCGNTASMLSNTRYGKHFKVVGDKSRHFGPFPCLSGKQACETTAQNIDSKDMRGSGCC